MKELGWKLVLLSTAMMLYTCQSSSSSSNLHPVILIPGIVGNQLEARLTSDYVPSSQLCKEPPQKLNDGWFRLWFDPTILLGPFTKCFSDRMMLHYDKDLDDYHNAHGVQTRVHRFGSTESLLYLNPDFKDKTTYMASLVESLTEIGYVDGKTLFGAPYDFRYGLAAQSRQSHVGSKFLEDLKILIEKASISNGGKPVILVSHSLGGLFVLHLLNRNHLSWRQKFIKHLVALSVPWGGTVMEMLTFASGYTLGIPLIKPLQVREEERSWESNLLLLPNPISFGGEKPLVVTPNATYSAYEIVQFLNDIGFPQGVYPYVTRILPLILEKLEAPGVPLTCIIGSGVKTPETLFYGENRFDKQPKIVYGDGDGTVNMVSLLALESMWANVKNQILEVIQVDGVDHSSILKDDVALSKIVDEISGINSKLISSVENIGVIVQ